jgi:hypothetical protein
LPGPTRTFERLEPCAGKLACTVLRGAGGRDAVRLLDKPRAPQEKACGFSFIILQKYIMTMKTTRAIFLAASAMLGAMALDPISGFNAASAAECTQNTVEINQINGHEVITDHDPATCTVIHEQWRKNGELDRTDGPAFILRDAATGTVTREIWSKDGKVDRNGGPAYIVRDAATGLVALEVWCKDGKQVEPPSPAANPVPAPG